LTVVDPQKESQSFHDSETPFREMHSILWYRRTNVTSAAHKHREYHVDSLQEITTTQQSQQLKNTQKIT